MSNITRDRKLRGHTLYEARVIMPMTTAHPNNLAAMRKLEHGLADAFGGFTASTASGWWKNPDDAKLVVETVRVFDIAMTDTDQNVDKLVALAREVGKMIDQHSVYIRFPDGRVFIEKL